MKQYTDIVQALVKLMDPLIEVAIHDLQTGKISFIAGSLSKRQIGDPSLLDGDVNTIEAYPKLNWDGRLIKSISIPLTAENALMCINCDVSQFQSLKLLAEKLISGSTEPQPASLFRKDWQERIHEFLHQQIALAGWNFKTITGAQKKNLVKKLFLQGAFEERKAADYIADVLNMGRATIFNYLREWKKNENHSL